VKRGTFTGDYTVHAVGSCVSSIIAMLTGSFVGYVANIKLWDVGAAVPLVQRFGFVMKFADGRPYEGTVDEESYILDPSSPRRWRMSNHLFMAPDEKTCDDLIAHTRF
jgi:fructose-1,6-bisphosphatase/inositol monophosphatase family enzyme